VSGGHPGDHHPARWSVGVRRVSVLCLAALTATACRTGARPPGASFAGASLLEPLSDSEVAHDGLLRADLARADSVARLGLAEGFASNFSSSVVYLRHGLPIVRGREAALAIVRAESSPATTAVRWQPVRAEASRDGKSGYTYGYTIYSAAQPGAPSIHVDRYIAFWRREPAGWRIVGYAETYGATPPTLALPPEAERAVLRDEPMTPTRGALDAIRAADTDFSRDASRLGTGEAFGRYAAEDAQIFSAPGEFITGPGAIMQSFGPSTRQSALAWHPVLAEISESGDLGFTVGNAVFSTQRENGQPLLRHSKYLTVWKKQRDGNWRYVVDGGSARPAP
jgi:ketosteroid isomerase-like protein